jgi:hypothetical protein
MKDWQRELVQSYTRPRAESEPLVGNSILRIILDDLDDAEVVCVVTLGDDSEAVFGLRERAAVIYQWDENNSLKKLHLGQLHEAKLLETNRSAQIASLQVIHPSIPCGSATFHLNDLQEPPRIEIRDALLANLTSD